jgi:hypothetical protein
MYRSLFQIHSNSKGIRIIVIYFIKTERIRRQMAKLKPRYLGLRNLNRTWDCSPSTISVLEFSSEDKAFIVKNTGAKHKAAKSRSL